MVDKDSFITLTQTLDSLRDVVLAEFALTELDNEKDTAKSKEETQKFAGDMLIRIQELVKKIASSQQAEWLRLNPIRAKDFEAHVKILRESKEAGPCPPGFESVGGVCVRM